MSRFTKALVAILSLIAGIFIIDGLLLIYSAKDTNYELHSPNTGATSTSVVSHPVSTSSKPTPTTPTLGLSQQELLKTMNLTFEDDFNSLSFYTDKNGNTNCHPGGIGRWQTVYHFCSRTIFSNNEAELYIDQVFLDYARSKGTVTSTTIPFSTENGILTIEAKPITPEIKKLVGNWANYTSGLLTTQFSFSQTYGYFEMRAKLPVGKGLWPAFWLLPVDKTWPPEIDVMEAFGGTNHLGEGTETEIHYATHAVKKSESCGNWVDFGKDITADFHTYGVNWQPSGVTYYFDGVPYAKCPITGDFHKPFYMLINLAVGGTGSWPDIPDATNVWPAQMQVDYVRAYQNK